MGTFAETAIVVFHLWFPRPMKNNLPFSILICSKQEKVCHFRLRFPKVQFLVCTCVCIYINIHIYIYICMLPYQTENRKQDDFP